MTSVCSLFCARWCRCTRVLLILLALMLVAMPASAVSYRVRSLGSGTSRAVNSAGQILLDYSNHSYVWQNNTLTDLGMLSGATASVSCSINSLGQVVGYDSIGGYTYPYLWQNGQKTPISAPNSKSGAIAINDSGRILGWSYQSNGAKASVLWSGGSIQTLGSLDAADLNKWGVMCATMWTGTGDKAIYLRNSGGTQVFLAVAYGEGGGVSALNYLNHVVGISNKHAFLWNGTKMVDLGTLGGTNSAGMDVNDQDKVVGWSYNNAGLKRAFIWEGTSMVDLGTLPGGLQSEAYAISNNGWIVGSSDGTPVLWEPVPEPSSTLALLCGCVSIFAGRTRRRIR